MDVQLLTIFLENLSLCSWLKQWWTPGGRQWIAVDGVKRHYINHVAYAFPGSDNSYNDEFVLLDSGVNAAKEGMWGTDNINSEETMTDYQTQRPEKAIKNLKDVLSAMKYHQDPVVRTHLINQAARVETKLDDMERILAMKTGYQPANLGARWRTWIRGRADLARTKAETYLTTHLQTLQDGYTSEYQQQPQFSPDKVLLEKINRLAAAIANRQPWINPFP
ncbi:MAG: hypothetical protein Q9178_006231 [Gyalolechia marmorata]